MTGDEKRDLNRRVAKAMGWEVKQGVTGWGWFRGSIPASYTWPTRGAAERHVPDFCTDPAAADLVRREFRRRRIAYTENYLPAIPGLRCKDMLCVHWDLGDGLDCDTHWGDTEDFTALCWALIAACEVTKKTEKGGVEP